VALTLDHDHLDPFGPDLARRTAEVASILDRLGLAVVIETGARYLLDPWRKHAPTLLDDDPALRVQFLRRAVRVGADLGAEAVSFWSGVPPTGATGAAGVTGVTDGPAGASGGPAGGPDGGTFWDRLVRGCAEIVDVAADLSVMLGFEPEPGMLVADIAGWRRLYADLGSPPGFGITLDIGHCQCLEPLPVPECVRAVADHLVNVQIDDMRRGVHEHLEFGTGEIDFPPVLRALAEVGYSGLVAVELPRHSHAAPSVAAHSIAFLHQASIAAGLTGAGQTTSLGCEMTTLDELRAAVPTQGWLGEALDRVAGDPTAIERLFPAAGRRCGRGPLPGVPGWRTDEAARALLLAALPADRVAAGAEVLYRHGDSAEKLAVLKALPLLPIGDEAVPLLRDAIRTNDTRLVAAALGPYARHLDDAAWRQAVLKCVFMGIPLSAVDGLDDRADAELATMLAGLVAERTAAGRDMAPDALALLDRLKGA